MIKGTIYLLVIIALVITCALGEIKYHIECKKLTKRHLNPRYFTARVKTYFEALLISAGTTALIATIIEMINTWNDPL